VIAVAIDRERGAAIVGVEEDRGALRIRRHAEDLFAVASAVAWNTYTPGKTWVFGTKAACEGAVCTGYALVVCQK
jgi:hypothetical protein